MFLHPGLETRILQALFGASTNPYVLLDRGLHIVGANAAYLQVTARTLDELVGQPLFEAFPSDPASAHGQQLRQSLARVLQTGQPDHIAAIHYPIVDARQRLTHRVWSATHVPLVDAGGQVTHVLQHTEDVTHLQRGGTAPAAGEPVLAAHVLRRAEAVQETLRTLTNEREYLRAIFEQAPGFVAVLRGPEHVFELANAAHAALVGDRPLIGRRVADALPELIGQGFLAQLDQAYASGRATLGRAVPVRLRRHDGAAPELRHVDYVMQPVRAADGRVHGLFVQGHDVSAQVVAEQRADVHERRFDTLAHTLPLPVWTARPDGRLDWCNERLRDSLPAAVDEAGAAADWLPHVHPDDAPAARAAWQRALGLRQPVVLELRLQGRDGHHRWHLVQASPVRDDAGRITQWVGSNTDIDDQKAGSALLADLNNELQRRVDERSAELMRTQEALRHSQQLEAIGSLAGGIAHEFNNLLQVIGGNLDLLAGALPADGPARERFGRARQAVHRGADLAGQLLAYGRRQPLQPDSLDLAQLVGGLNELLQRTLGEGVRIATAVAPDLWPTLADAAMVEHALLNLALNARDAMDGRGHLTIEAGNAVIDAAYAQRHGDVQPGDYVLLTVTDTGCGMGPDVQARAFEPFFTTKPRGQGSGLGLSMVFGFVKQSGGHVKLYSEPGHGTAVRLYLPRSASAPVAAAPPPAGEAAPAAPPPPQVVLVVEDDDAVRQTVAEQLIGLGHAVHTAHDAADALQRLQAGLAVDVLFTDVVMPGALSGPELAQQALALRPGLRVLFTSGYPENALLHGGRFAAGQRLLSKPYTRQALAQALADLPPAEAAAEPALLRVLLCEDDDLVRESVDELLSLQQCQVVAVATLAAARQALQAGDDGAPLDLLITDLNLPDGPGLAFAQEARARWPRLRVVFASGRGGREAAATLDGALHLDKPFGIEDLEALVLALRRTG